METIIKELEGVKLICHPDFLFKKKSLDDYPPCCGPAYFPLVDKLIPDSFFGINFAVACDIHDFDFDNPDKSWTAFHAANGRLMRNMFEIYYQFEMNLTARQRRLVIGAIVTYMRVVDTAGSIYYWRIK